MRRKWIITPGLALLLALGLGACSDSQENAIKALDRAGLPFTVAEFHNAAAAGNLEAVMRFMDAGMEVNVAGEDGTTALVRAVEGDALEVAAWLIDQGAVIDESGPGGRTPLLAAVQGDSEPMVRLLLEAGADPMLKDREDWSPLARASFEGHAGLVEVLAPKSTELLDDALLISAFGGDPEVIDLLLANGAYVNARSPNNQTSLMIAAMNGHLDAVKLLLHNGANRYALDDDEATAANLAMANEHLEVGDLLNQPIDPLASGDDYLPYGEEVVMEGALPPGEIAVVEEAVFMEGGDLEAELVESPVVSTGSTSSAVPARPSAVPVRQPVVRSRPMRANGAAIEVTQDDRSQVPQQFRLREYREEHLPVVLKNVDAETAEVRVLYGSAEPVRVRPGEPIGDTGLEVVKFQQQFANSKHGKGHLVDVSQMVVEDRRTGAKHLLVKDVPAHSSETFAVMQLGDSGEPYDVRPEDEFTASGPGFEEHFRVVEVRPTQVIIENTTTDELHTIHRSARSMQ